MLLTVPLAGCVHTAITNDVPPCERLIHPSLLAPTEVPELPVSAKLEDGHDDARPWQAGFVEAVGGIEKADLKTLAVDWSYRECLKQHRERLEKSKRGFFGRIFG